MLREPIIIINKFGLHTRAAAKLVATATKFTSKIELVRNTQVVDAKSIMGVITLCATKGTTLDLIISGTDEIAARDAMVELFNNRFGEAE